MANLPVMNLPYYLNMVRSLDGSKIYAVLLGEIEPPAHLATTKMVEPTTKLVVADLIGVETPSGTYYVKGRIVTSVHRQMISELEKKSTGRLAVVLTKSPIRLADAGKGAPEDFVQMLKWGRHPEDQSWGIARTHAEQFKRADHPEFFQVIVEAFKNDWQYRIPSSAPVPYNLACGDYEFKKLTGEVIPPYKGVSQEGSSETAPARQQAPNAVSTPPEPQKQERVFDKPAGDDLFSPVPENFGSATTSGISTLVDNKRLTSEDLKGRVRFKIENRTELAPLTNNAKQFSEMVDGAAVLYQDKLQELRGYVASEASVFRSMKYMADQLKASWTRSIGFATGSALFKEALELALPQHATLSASNTSPISETITALGTSIVDNWLSIEVENLEIKVIEDVFENRILIYFTVIEILLGLKGKLLPVYHTANREGMDMVAIIEHNPYDLVYLDPSFRVEDLDKIALLYGVDVRKSDLSASRNVAYMHNLMLDSNNPDIGDNTTVRLASIEKHLHEGFIVSKADYSTIQVEGTLLNSEQISTLRFFVNQNLESSNFKFPREGWKQVYNSYFLPYKNSKSNMIADYIESGLGMVAEFEGVRYITDYIYAFKERYIYTRLRELCSQGGNSVPVERLRKTIKDFETLKEKEFGMQPGEFRLEGRQSEAVMMLNNRILCLTGPAGSGKTTTAEAMVFALEKCFGISEEKIVFCAPTGRAAGRLKEVVKRDTRTINSVFGIGGSTGIVHPDECDKAEDIRLLIVDETSMPTIHLMYEVVCRLEEGTRVLFLGDIEQLPPIGVGKPFATMMTYLPTVVLNVSKRASEGSLITRNANKILFESDGIIEDLEEGDEFKLVHDKDPNSIVRKVSDIIRYHLGKGEADSFTPATGITHPMNPDDIQIITPVNKHNWGVHALNEMVHDTFNRKQMGEDSIIFNKSRNEKREFRLRDRVMHTISNDKERTRLRHLGGNKFSLLDSKGIFNGEVGKVMGFYRAADLDFSETRIGTEEELTQQFGTSENTMYMAVKYTDVDVQSQKPIDYLIFYRMTVLNRHGGVIDVMGKQLNNIQLAYAATVHKLQGSQAKLVVMVLLPVGKGSFATRFISRNMIYTGITRAKEGVYMIGDVMGRDSCVTKGRKFEATAARMSPVDMF